MIDGQHNGYDVRCRYQLAEPCVGFLSDRKGHDTDIHQHTHRNKQTTIPLNKQNIKSNREEGGRKQEKKRW